MLEDSHLRKEYGKNGLERVKKEYTYEKMINQYFELYEKGIKNWQE